MKAPQTKPPNNKSTTKKTAGAQSSKVEKITKTRKTQLKKLPVQSSNTMQPPKQKKPPTIKKMVEPISNRKLAWEMIEEKEK
jgi:hypothetical protein